MTSHSEQSQGSLAEENLSPWEEIADVIRELRWYASRKADLAKPLPTNPKRTFADMLDEEIDELAAAVAKARNL